MTLSEFSKKGGKSKSRKKKLACRKNWKKALRAIEEKTQKEENTKAAIGAIYPHRFSTAENALEFQKTRNIKLTVPIFIKTKDEKGATINPAYESAPFEEKIILHPKELSI